MSKKFRITIIASDDELAAVATGLTSAGIKHFHVRDIDSVVADGVAENGKPEAVAPAPKPERAPKAFKGRRPYDGTHAHEVLIQAIKASGKPLTRPLLTRALQLRGFNEGSFSGAMNRAKNLGWVATDKFRNGHFSLTELGQSMLIRWSPEAKDSP